MTKIRIQQLVRFMPDNLEEAVPDISRQPLEPLSQRLAVAMNDPGFGNRFVRSFVSRRKPFPSAVHESYLRRAYNHYAGLNTTDDLVMVEIVQLLYPQSRFTKAVLEALLICQDVTIAQIAGWVSLKPEVVQIYEQLHFNVRDRKDEKVYLASLAFPDGRVQMLRTDAADKLSFTQQLLQAGYLHGAQEVLVLAGLDTSSKLPSLEQGILELEESIVANARLLVRSGHENSTKSPGINQATKIIAARRNATLQNAPGQPVDPMSSMGLTANVLLGPGDAIKHTVDGILADATRNPIVEDQRTILAAVEAQRQEHVKSITDPASNS